MINRVSMTNKPLKAGRIYIKDNAEPLKDKIIIFTDTFLVVGDNEDDQSPTLYNIEQIVKLEGVELVKPTRQTQERNPAQWKMLI